MKGYSCALSLLTFTFLQKVSLLSCQQVYKSNLILGTDAVETVNLAPDEVVPLSLPHVTPTALYAMVQFHSQQRNLTISTSKMFNPAVSKSGTNVGLVVPVKRKNDGKSLVVYIKSSNATTNITAIGIVHFLENFVPLPGGCNQVFNLERDPNIEITYSSGRTNLLFQWANQAAVNESDCDDKKIQNNLEYDVYAYYLDPSSLSEDDYIDAMKMMLTASSITDKSHKVETLHNGLSSKPELSIMSESNRGVVYSIVARMKDTGLSTPYVAAATYSCDFSRGDCSVKLSAGEILLLIVSSVVGGFLLLLGHRMFKMSQFLFGYMFVFALSYLLLMTTKTTGNTNSLIIAGSLGVLGGVVWLALWLLFAFPILAVFVPGLCTGYLMSATVFFTPFANLDWWERNDNYALAFVCVILLYTVLLMAYSKHLSIMSCSITGAYILLLAAAIPLHSSFRLIISFTVYRQTLEDFGKVQVTVPMLTPDIILMVLWPVFTILGIVFQLYRQRGLPDFDLPERKSWKRRFSRSRPQLYVSDSDEEHDGAPQVNGNERERLLPNSHQQPYMQASNYNSIDGSPTRGENPRRKQKNFLR